MSNTNEQAFVDPIMREWNLGAMVTGWTATTGNEAMDVLASLANHLKHADDTVGSQLLARIWRFNSPVLKHICEMDTPEVVEKRKALLELLNTVATRVGVKVGDDILGELLPKLLALVQDAELLQGICRMAGHWQDGSSETVTISDDECTREYIVRVGGGPRGRTYTAGSTLHALRKAVAAEDDRMEHGNG